MFIAGVNDTAEKLFTGVNDTADKFFGGVNDTGEYRVLPILACQHLKMKNKQKFNIFKNFISKFLSFFPGVVDTADKHSFAIISANFRKNLKRSQLYTQRPGGH
jgi:hypothetical protein